MGGGGGVTGLRVKDAPTLVAAVIGTTQAPVPLHAPLQPEKVEPEAAVGVSVTEVPWGKVALHIAPQLIPAGLLMTEPLPVPERPTVSICGAVAVEANVAVTAVAALIVTTQEPVPRHAPLQPENVEPEAGVAVSVTAVPCG